MKRSLICCLAILGCSEVGLHALVDGQDGEEQEFGTANELSAPETSPTTEDSTAEQQTEGAPVDTGEWVDTGDWAEISAPVHVPEVCSVDTMVQMAGAPADCPDHYATFMMDDGNGPNFICCPLPATDILVGEPQERGSSCDANEVITGFSSGYTYRCTAINLERYQVGSRQEPCYFGSGASGGSGVSGCAAHPHTWDVLAQTYFGSDGCSGYPYGSLFVSHTDKDCEDIRTVSLSYSGNVDGDPPAGTPVEMFVE